MFLMWLRALWVFCTLRSLSALRWSLASRALTTSLRALSAEQIATRKDQVLAVLRSIIDPEKGQDVLSTGRIDQVDIDATGQVKFTLHSPSRQSAVAEELRKLCQLQVGMLDWVENVDIAILRPAPPPAPPSSVIALDPISPHQQIRHIVAVSSCKGGVGKSTVAVNLAYALRTMGYAVGILDADIYGPSLPTMTSPAQKLQSVQGNAILPVEYEGVKLVSMGFLNPGAAIMRGPMVNQLLGQLVQRTQWGTLDFLIVDMPPGTGDIQLTLAQTMSIDGAVIVTTPQRLAFVDVVKGIDMFDTVNVPCLAVVENMHSLALSLDVTSLAERLVQEMETVAGPTSRRDALTQRFAEILSQTWTEQPLFGTGHTQRLREMWGFDLLLTLPLEPQLSVCGDTGRPYVLRHRDTYITQQFATLAKAVAEEVQRKTPLPQVTYDESANHIVFNDKTVDSRTLRCACRCAACIDEFTQRKLLQDDTVALDVKPVTMAPIGRYAWSISWSDGHKSLFPYKQLAALTTDVTVP